MSVDPTVRTRLNAALERHARHRMRWGGDVVRQIEPTAVRYLRVWSAQLDTLIEERSVRKVTRAARADEHESEGRDNSMELNAWSIEVDVPAEFEDLTTQVEIAGTDHIKTCSLCHGETKIRCPECGGEGKQGYRKTCLTCRGTGLADCDACEGEGRLTELQAVEIFRRHEVSRHVDQDTPIPVKVLSEATRDELLHLDIPRVDQATYEAMMGAYRGRGPEADAAFEEAVRGMVVTVNVEDPARVVRQRLVVRHLPVVEVDYDWRGDPGRFWLVGSEERVYGEEMPIRGAYVSRAVSAAKERFGAVLGRGVFGRANKE